MVWQPSVSTPTLGTGFQSWRSNLPSGLCLASQSDGHLCPHIGLWCLRKKEGNYGSVASYKATLVLDWVKNGTHWKRLTNGTATLKCDWAGRMKRTLPSPHFPAPYKKEKNKKAAFRNSFSIRWLSQRLPRHPLQSLRHREMHSAGPIHPHCSDCSARGCGQEN